MSRYPVPAETHKIKGTFRPDRHKSRPASSGNAPTCPELLRGEARREWTRVIKRLSKLRIVDEIDRGLISVYCLAWGRLHGFEKRILELQAEQETCTDGKRVEQIDKALWKLDVSLSKAYDQFIKAADRLGVGPLARARVKVQQEETELNPFEEFLSQRKSS